jgi:hypothetical protein
MRTYIHKYVDAESVLLIGTLFSNSNLYTVVDAPPEVRTPKWAP